MAWFRVKYLVCGGCGHKFMARDENGSVRKGAATVRHILTIGIRQFCGQCGQEWKAHRKVTRG